MSFSTSATEFCTAFTWRTRTDGASQCTETTCLLLQPDSLQSTTWLTLYHSFLPPSSDLDVLAIAHRIPRPSALLYDSASGALLAAIDALPTGTSPLPSPSLGAASGTGQSKPPRQIRLFGPEQVVQMTIKSSGVLKFVWGEMDFIWSGRPLSLFSAGSVRSCQLSCLTSKTIPVATFEIRKKALEPNSADPVAHFDFKDFALARFDIADYKGLQYTIILSLLLYLVRCRSRLYCLDRHEKD